MPDETPRPTDDRLDLNEARLAELARTGAAPPRVVKRLVAEVRELSGRLEAAHARIEAALALCEGEVDVETDDIRGALAGFSPVGADRREWVPCEHGVTHGGHDHAEDTEWGVNHNWCPGGTPVPATPDN